MAAKHAAESGAMMIEDIPFEDEEDSDKKH